MSRFVMSPFVVVISRVVDLTREYVGLVADGVPDARGRRLGWTTDRLCALVWSAPEVAEVALQAWQGGELHTLAQEARALERDIVGMERIIASRAEEVGLTGQAWTVDDPSRERARADALAAYRAAQTKRDLAERQMTVGWEQRQGELPVVEA